MGKPTGFLEVGRELPPDRRPLERIQDWGEFHEEFPVLEREGGDGLQGFHALAVDSIKQLLGTVRRLSRVEHQSRKLLRIKT